MIKDKKLKLAVKQDMKARRREQMSLYEMGDKSQAPAALPPEKTPGAQGVGPRTCLDGYEKCPQRFDAPTEYDTIWPSKLESIHICIASVRTCYQTKRMYCPLRKRILLTFRRCLCMSSFPLITVCWMFRVQKA